MPVAVPGTGKPFQRGHDPRRKLTGPARRPRLSDGAPLRHLLRADRRANLDALRKLRDSEETPPALRADICFRLLEFDVGRPGVMPVVPDEDEPTAGAPELAVLLALPTADKEPA